jgi:hypothetical protein
MKSSKSPSAGCVVAGLESLLLLVPRMAMRIELPTCFQVPRFAIFAEAHNIPVSGNPRDEPTKRTNVTKRLVILVVVVVVVVAVPTSSILSLIQNFVHELLDKMFVQVGMFSKMLHMIAIMEFQHGNLAPSGSSMVHKRF